eukprot:GAHX01001791.1.p1 GENE.GAHX01001791.1~~GAHX01001791.1.p1  ORF type:complete len:952 (+),score=187.41 GAHX01001791.1:1385-4240(+)
MENPYTAQNTTQTRCDQPTNLHEKQPSINTVNTSTNGTAHLDNYNNEHSTESSNNRPYSDSQEDLSDDVDISYEDVDITSIRRCAVSHYFYERYIKNDRISSSSATSPDPYDEDCENQMDIINKKPLQEFYDVNKILTKDTNYLVDNSILAFKLLEFICSTNTSIVINTPPGTGKTFFANLVKDLPKYNTLKAFQRPKLNPQLYLQNYINKTDNSKRQQVVPFINIEKPDILKLYSETIVLHIDLNHAFNQGPYEDEDVSLLDCFLMSYIMEEFISKIISAIDLNKDQQTKLKEYKSRNEDLFYYIKEDKDQKQILQLTKKLYRELTIYVHTQIEKRILIRKTTEELDRLNNSDRTNVGVAVKKLVIMIDEVNILLSRTYQSTNGLFEQIERNFLFENMIYFKGEYNNKTCPTSIQFIFLSVLPPKIPEINDVIYPKFMTFAEFNQYNPHSFGEFTLNNFARTLPTSFDDLQESLKNIDKLVHGLKLNSLDITPFLERGILDKHILLLKEEWETFLKNSRIELKIPLVENEDLDINLINLSLIKFFTRLYEQQTTQNFNGQMYDPRHTENKNKKQVIKMKTYNKKLNTGPIINFLMAETLEGSIHVTSAYRHSTELETDDFWKIYNELTGEEKSFPQMINEKYFKRLFHDGIEQIKGCKNLFQWYMYNAGYVYFKEVDDIMEFEIKEDKELQFSNKCYLMNWMNYQTKLAFNTEVHRHKTGIELGNDMEIEIASFHQETLLESIIFNVVKLLESKTRGDFLKNHKKNERDEDYRQRITDNIAEEITQYQFETEFLNAFHKVLGSLIKRKLGDVTMSYKNKVFKLERQKSMFIFTEQLEGERTSQIQKLDVYGYLGFYKTVRKENDVHFCIELKRDEKEFPGLSVFYRDEKDFTKIESFKNRNVLFLAASIKRPDKEKEIKRMTDKGYKIPYSCKLIPFYRNKNVLVNADPY